MLAHILPHRQRTNSRSVSKRHRDLSRGAERLEHRWLLAANLQLGSLLPENGGDGSAGFVVNSGRTVSVAGDVNGDAINDMLVFDPKINLGGSKRSREGATYVVFGTQTPFPAEFDVATLDGSNGFMIAGNPADPTSCGVGCVSTRGSISSAGDLNGDGINDIAIAAEMDNSNNGAGKTYIVFGKDTDTDNNGVVDAPFPATIELAALDGTNGFVINGVGGQAGYSMHLGGDIDNDGVDDLLIGAPFTNVSTGEAYVVYGRDYDVVPPAQQFPSSYSLSTLAGGDGSEGFVIRGINENDTTGWNVTLGYLNGDAYADVVIGAREHGLTTGSAAGDAEGKVLVLYGAARSSFNGTFELSTLLPANGGNGTAGVVIDGIDTGDALRYVSAAGDINGDGYDDLAMGAPGGDPGGLLNAGESYVVFGGPAFPAGPVFDLGSLLPGNGGDGSTGFVIEGVNTDDESGRPLALSGDINGDGVDDLIVAAAKADPNGNTNAGEAYVIYGTSAGFPPIFHPSTLDGNNGFILVGEAGDYLASWWGAGPGPGLAVGDINDDAFDDIVISAADRTYVIYGAAEIVPAPGPGITVWPTAGLMTDESGATSAFEVVLTQLPDTDVVLQLASNDATEGWLSTVTQAASPTVSLTFTAGNWNQPQVVTVVGQNDSEPDGDLTYTLQVAVDPSSSVEYLAVDPVTVSVTNRDDGLDGASAKFFVVDADADQTFLYDDTGVAVTSTPLDASNSEVRGTTMNAAGDTQWTVEANGTVHVYDATGTWQSSWVASGLKKAEGITTDGVHIWIVDGSKARKVLRYDNAATTSPSGTVTPDASFTAEHSFTWPRMKGVTADGAILWIVVDDLTNLVLKYGYDGTYLGRWVLDPANQQATGITVDPTRPATSNLWVVDNGADAVFEYDRSGTLLGSFPLAPGNTNPQGIADPSRAAQASTSGRDTYLESPLVTTTRFLPIAYATEAQIETSDGVLHASRRFDEPALTEVADVQPDDVFAIAVNAGRPRDAHDADDIMREFGRDRDPRVRETAIAHEEWLQTLAIDLSSAFQSPRLQQAANRSATKMEGATRISRDNPSI